MSTLGDLFALSDEQILDIEPRAEVVSGQASDPSGGPVGPGLAPSDPTPQPVIPSLPAQAGEARTAASPRGLGAENPSSSASAEGKRDSSSPSAPRNDTAGAVVPPNGASEAPPKWLADMMADPQAGGEARDFWNGIVKAREEAHLAANRASQLEELDRAYFAGDAKSPQEVAAARERLAETLLREDPAAFREMVFAGLRALEKANVASRPVGTSSASATPAPENVGLPTSSGQVPPGATQTTGTDLASYAAFEKAANEDLDRDVRGPIARMLEQALPNAAKGDGAPLKERLTNAVRQDIEAALRGDRQLGEQVAQILAARRFDGATRAQVVRLIGERARQLVPAAAKRVLNDWTQTALAAHRARAQKTEAAAARPDVEGVGGAPASVPARATAPREIDYRKLSDEQILNL